MNYKILFFVSFFLFSFSPLKEKIITPNFASFSSMTIVEKKAMISIIYNNLETNHNSLPNIESFEKGIQGFYALKEKGKIKKDILTIVDFSLPSNQKRLWVIDLNNNKILYNTLVAHGLNSGGLYAKSFSNVLDSNKSSLGFFSTGECYVGKHGLSLKLDGLENGINNKARVRDVVIHGASYVSKSYIEGNKYLGRSLGCPAIPQKLSKDIIKIIKNQSCLFIYHPNKAYALKAKIVS
jgi:hypothetical protein